MRNIYRDMAIANDMYSFTYPEGLLVATRRDHYFVAYLGFQESVSNVVKRPILKIDPQNGGNWGCGRLRSDHC